MSTTTNTTDAARILAAIRRSWPQRWPWFLALAAFLLLVTGPKTSEELTDWRPRGPSGGKIGLLRRRSGPQDTRRYDRGV